MNRKNPNKPRPRWQEKLSTKPDAVTGRNDYEDLHMEYSESGPFVASDCHKSAVELIFFTEALLKDCQSRFEIAVQKRVNSDSYLLIKKGLEAYVRSSVSDNNDLQRLKASIYRAWSGTNYHKKEKNVCKKVSENELIPESDLKNYQKIAERYTINAFKRFCKYLKSDTVANYSDMLVYRGLNSRYYYKDENKDPDFISEYAATEFDQHYHETNLLTSYTISFSVAEQFMNMRKSQRRAFIHGSMDIVLGRIFSSFVVEPSFVKDQFEMLCTQNDYPILISNLCNYEPIDESYDEKNNEITADFMLMRG